ncbi:NADPH:quinone reductase-like Zn-dependent oxidoreductase [Antricoccus suffuscus]|uniref:NADPH:quinone reductase-like Zn-dependent oxidoreductase n=1 Tax=Antricoccus suffuscus TaxID=1629062 RepID=A0A2T0ZWA0_9ACTN|nr:NADP-dependent oxidoreductase [Antricoccus suffuscus]PRZ40626.1 NADPH:quinone reductase-like Zn-dependent oxidoreductase [Antricoccus suffuscus]
MRVVGVMEFNGPQALQVYDVPEQHAGPGEVRLKVSAAAVNPTDTYIPTGQQRRPNDTQTIEPPYVPGMDAAGVIDEIGPDTQTDLKVGDRAMGIVIPKGAHGGYSESLVLPVGSVAKAPAGTSHVEAATLPMNGLTARLALDLLKLRPGQTLLVTGAAGAFGGYTVQLAKADGLRVIADAAEKDTELVKALGADVILPRGDDLAARVREIEPDGVDAVADGALLNELVIPAIRDGGALAAVRGFKVAEERGIVSHPVWVRAYAEEQGALDTLRQQTEDGVVTLRVARTFPAAEAGAAQQMLAAGGVRGRLVIEF